MAAKLKPDIDAIFRDRTQLDVAIREAARQALIHHKRIGNPVADWQDGKVVLVQPEDIVIPPPPGRVTGTDAA